MFEGLLGGQHNRRLMKLLYRMSEWHALAKLRMHTQDSLVLMDEITKELGDLSDSFGDSLVHSFAQLSFHEKQTLV